MMQENVIPTPIVSGIWYFMGIPFVIGAAVALFSPIDVLKYDIFRVINEIASFIFPAVRKMKGDYELGQVAKLYFSVMWLMSPFLFIGGYRDIQRQAEKIIKRCREGKFISFLFCGVFFPAIAILTTMVTFESKDLDDFRAFLTFHSRWGMSIWGFVIPAGASVMYAITAFWVKNFVRLFD